MAKAELKLERLAGIEDKEEEDNEDYPDEDEEDYGDYDEDEGEEEEGGKRKEWSEE